jgi:hypothetical protein
MQIRPQKKVKHHEYVKEKWSIRFQTDKLNPTNIARKATNENNVAAVAIGQDLMPHPGQIRKPGLKQYKLVATACGSEA